MQIWTGIWIQFLLLSLSLRRIQDNLKPSFVKVFWETEYILKPLSIYSMLNLAFNLTWTLDKKQWKSYIYTHTHTHIMECVVHFHSVGFWGWVSCFRHLSSFFLLFKLEMLSMSTMSKYYDGGICPIWDLWVKVGQNIKLCLFDKANVFNVLIYWKQQWLSQCLLSLLEISITLKIEFFYHFFFWRVHKNGQKNL